MTNDKLIVNKIYRILDANINRAMEGLRVTEEIARFILEDKAMTEKIKSLRNRLKKAVSGFSKRDLLSARKSLSDVGGKLYTEEESKRANLKSVFKSNIKRAEEAIRVLEEFSKLIDKRSGKEFKTIRFDLYELEKKIVLKLD